MQNQINMGDRDTQQIGQNDVNQPIDTPEKSGINHLVIGGIILTCLVVLGFGGYYLGKQSSNKNLVSESSLTPILSPTPSEASDKTVNWTSYDITTEPLLGYADYVVKVPSNWKQIEHSSNFQDTETFQDTYGQFTYQLVIHQQKNYNEQTGKPYITLKELTGFPYDVTTLIVDGQQAARVLPRAGSESIYKVLFFSKDTKLVISIELDTPRDGSKVKDGEELFNQILSTFKFLTSSDVLDKIEFWTQPMIWSAKKSETIQYATNAHQDRIDVSGFSRTSFAKDKSENKIGPLTSSDDTRLKSEGWIEDQNNSGGGVEMQRFAYYKDENEKRQVLFISQTSKLSGIEFTAFLSDPFAY